MHYSKITALAVGLLWAGVAKADLLVTSGYISAGHFGGYADLNLSDGEHLFGAYDYAGDFGSVYPLQGLFFFVHKTPSTMGYAHNGDFSGGFSADGKFFGDLYGPGATPTGPSESFVFFTGAAVAEYIPSSSPFDNFSERSLVRFLTPNGTPTPEPATGLLVVIPAVIVSAHARRRYCTRTKTSTV